MRDPDYSVVVFVNSKVRIVQLTVFMIVDRELDVTISSMIKVVKDVGIIL